MQFEQQNQSTKNGIGHDRPKREYQDFLIAQFSPDNPEKCRVLATHFKRAAFHKTENASEEMVWITRLNLKFPDRLDRKVAINKAHSYRASGRTNVKSFS
jgi:hypothetical protein